MSITASDPALVKTIQAAVTDFDQLSKTEQAQFHSWAHIICANINAAFEMYTDGMIEESLYTAYRRSFQGLIVTPGGSRWWEVTQPLWPPDFAEDINNSLEEEKGDIVSWNVMMPFFAQQD